MKRRALLFSALLFSLAGVILSLILTRAHFSESGGWVASVCGALDTGCASVLRSRWAVFPPAPPGGLDRENLGPLGHVGSGIPVAALGMFHFTALFLLLAVVGLPGSRRRRLLSDLIVLVFISCLFSVAWIVLMATQVPGWCSFCLLVHACNFAVFGVLFLLRRDLRRGDDGGVPPTHPGARLLLTTTALILATCTALWSVVRAQALSVETRVLGQELDSMRKDAGLVELTYFGDNRFTSSDEARRTFDRVIRPDDPMLGPRSGPRMTLVSFTDLECGNCRRFDRFLTEVILPLFHGHLQVVFKHFPLKETFQHSERAAFALEAARLQGRFWEYHARLGEREDLGEVDMIELAAEVGLDPERFAADMDSDPVRDRVEQDRAFARELEVSATPTIFLNRRRVSGMARLLPGFWSLRADALKRYLESEGVAW